MRPAFDNTMQAAAFACLLLFLLAAPWLAGKNFLPPRDQAYASEGWHAGPYPWIQKQIFLETNDIDIAFLGSSEMAFGIDTPYVEQKLDQRVGRRTTVRSICWFYPGFDTLYFVAKDLLEHRRVHTLVFYDETTGKTPNQESPHWFYFGQNAEDVSGLPAKEKCIYYFAAMVGMPRNLLELLTPNLPEPTNNLQPNFLESYYHSANPEARLGSIGSQTIENSTMGKDLKFVNYVPRTGVMPSDMLIYNAETSSNFAFSNRPLPGWQIYFARKFGLLVKEHGVKLILLHIPTFDERESSVVVEPRYWPEFMQMDVQMLGIPSGKLFNGLTMGQKRQLFVNPAHLNQNGQKYFTSLVTPALLNLYENRHLH